MATAVPIGGSSGCISATTDPSALLNCPSGTPAVLASSGPSGGPGSPTPKSTPIVDSFNQIQQENKQNDGGLKFGGAIGAHFARGGAVRKYAAGGAGTTGTTTSTCPINAAGVPVDTPNANAGIEQTEVNSAVNPTLSSAETLKPTLLQDTSCQELCPNSANVGTPQVSAQTAGNAATASQVAAPPAATYQAATIGNPAFSVNPSTTPGSTTGGTGTTAANTQSACALVSNQIAMLTNGLNACNAPAWAQPSINAANSTMAARGLGTSSIAAGAEVGAIQQAALPVAQANSSVIMQTEMANQAAINAAAQFNATSQNQVSQFFANLNSQIQLSNAAQQNAMAQFNTGQLNSVSEYNATLANNVAQFNAQNQLAIEQSNVTWRRNINTVNTAATNAANQVNVQNEFNMSQTAQNNLWQQFQDEASWANTDAQNALTRASNMAIAVLGAKTAFGLQSSAEQAQLLGLVGALGVNILTTGGSNSLLSQGISSLFGSGGGSVASTINSGSISPGSVSGIFCG